MIYKMVSSKAVIAKIIADLNLNEKDIKITDIKQFIGDACMNIGAVNQLDHKVVTLRLKDYQCKLPCDLERLNSVAYSTCENGGWIPMKKSTGTFSVYDRKKKDCNCDCEMMIQDNALFPLVKNMFNLVDDRAALDKLNEDTNLRQTLSCLLNDYTVCSVNGNHKHLMNGTNFSNTVQYDIKPGYLVSNVPEGFVKLSYHAIYTDDEGMPMIPDLNSYFEAIYWYVAMKLYYPKYLSGDIPQHVYYDMKRSYNFYRKQAYAESLLPNQDELTDIKHTWNTLVPEVDEDLTFFSTTGDRQRIYNQNYGGVPIWR